MTILVLTRPNDGTAGGVTAELERRGVIVTRCDVGDFPSSITMAASLADHQSWFGSLTVAGEVCGPRRNSSHLLPTTDRIPTS